MNYRDYKTPNYVSMTEMCQAAKAGKYAIGQFNPLNAEYCAGILKAAQNLKSPVILGLSESAIKYFGGFKTCTDLIIALASDLKITVPFAIHLDHGTSIEVCFKAIDAGFSSVMYDGSKLPIDENAANAKKVADYAHKNAVSFECEVGIVGGEEDNVVGSVRYATQEDCLKIVNVAHPDLLAASLGSVHGHYHGEPVLGFNEMMNISQATKLPLVLHGGTGIPNEMLMKAIAAGEAKINIGTDVKEAFFNTLNNYFTTKQYQTQKKGTDSRVYLRLAQDAVQAKVEEKMRIFGSLNKVQ